LTGNDPDEMVKAQTADEMAALEILRTIPLESRAIVLAAMRGIADEITKK
jgi:hypothetical protein